MTDKEKAQAYDEALNKAKIEINTKGIGETVNLCEQLFPELRENEDESLKNKSGYYKAGKFWKASTLWNATKNKIPQRVSNRYILQECTWNIGNLQDFANEVKNVQEVSLDYPIILDMNGNIIDGAHRVVKAYLEGKDIDIVYLGDDEWPEPDYDEEKAVKESEDERIRKELINWINGKTTYEWSYEWCENKDRWIAYLEKQKNLDKMIVVSPEVWDTAISDAYENGRKDGEKQKEQKPDSLIYDKDLDKAAREFYLSGGAASPVDSTGLVPIVRMAEFGATWMKERMEKEQKPCWNPSEEDVALFNKAITTNASLSPQERAKLDILRMKFKHRPVIEQKEQKPAEWSDTNELVFKDICKHLKEEGYNGWIVLLNALRNGEFQQKQEWSEEDADILNCCISSIEEAKENRYAYKETDGDTSYDREIAWLKSLRPQSKAKLTLLDENIIDAAIAFVEQNNHFSFWGGIDKHTVIKALRSLKSKWKPTDEQMEALKNSAYGFYQNGDGPILRELYEQLKKLI